MNLNVMKSHMGQYMMPLSSVGTKSRFNRATICSPLSPEHKHDMRYLKIVIWTILAVDIFSQAAHTLSN